jgi:hypothetical protein
MPTEYMKQTANNTGWGQNDKQTYTVKVSAEARALEHRESVTQTVCLSEDLMIFGQLTPAGQLSLTAEPA